MLDVTRDYDPDEKLKASRWEEAGDFLDTLYLTAVRVE
jgi:hypothetical protein